MFLYHKCHYFCITMTCVWYRDGGKGQGGGNRGGGRCGLTWCLCVACVARVTITVLLLFGYNIRVYIAGEAEKVVAAVGGRAFLPCNLTQPGDSPILVLVYNGVTGKPVYR